MRRRKFITLLGGAAAGLPLAAHALQIDPVRRVGVLLNGSAGDSDSLSYIMAFQEALEKFG